MSVYHATPGSASLLPRQGLLAWHRQLQHGLGLVRRRLAAEAERVGVLVEAQRRLDDSALDVALQAMRGEARRGRLLGTGPATRELRAQALALVVVACERSLQWQPYPDQWLAALAMHEGMLVTMAAGEGKTLALALVTVLHAWRGHPCHVATANDYLAHRDAELMRPLFSRCGLKAASLGAGVPPEQVPEAYQADVVYATSRQLLADYLRDQLMLGGVDDPLRMRLRMLAADASAQQPIMRGLHVLLADDAETVLLDEATTPVVITAPSDNPLMIEAVRGAHELVGHLQIERDYRYVEQQRDIEFSAEGDDRLEQHHDLLPPLWRNPDRRDDLVRQALAVRDRLQPQRHYVVQQGRVTILDEQISRILARPTWMLGLLQAIELREGLEPTPPSRTLARMGLTQFFRCYQRVAGIGAAVHRERIELRRSLGLYALNLSGRKNSSLRVDPPGVWRDREEKMAALVDAVVQLHQRGQSVLVNLRRLPDAGALAQQLDQQGIRCQFLNLRQPGSVGDALNLVPQPGQITLALNLDAAGNQIAATPAGDDPVGASDAGLHILQYETQDLARQDQRILDLAGRRGQAGHARQYFALDDDLLRHQLPECCGALLVWLHRHSPKHLPTVVRWLHRHAQRRALVQTRRQRQLQPRREALLNQQLAFAGVRDMDVGIAQFSTLSSTLRKD